MNLLEAIDGDERLFGVVHGTCEENGARVSFCADICDGDDSQAGGERVRVIKLDEFFARLRLPETPSSVDCVIVIERDDGYEIHLVELKDVRYAKNLSWTEVVNKFHSTVSEFLIGRLADLFLSEDYELRLFRLIVITTHFGPSGEGKAKRLKKLAQERMLSVRPCLFRGRRRLPEVDGPSLHLC